MFSPYYAWSGRHSPRNHCALNVCLYGPGARRWAMTERREQSVETGADHFTVGPSHVRFEDGALIFDIEEKGAPIPLPVRGRVVVRPEAEQSRTFTLDRQGRHVWRPVWPRAKVSAQFSAPDLSWTGDGYVDMNAGAEPLERGFRSWDWARTPVKGGAVIHYDRRFIDGGSECLAVEVFDTGASEIIQAAPASPLPQTGWRVAREARSDGAAQIIETLEDTPFYSRSLIETVWRGERRVSMHESLDLKRFSSSVVKAMLPFRMPRVFW